MPKIERSGPKLLYHQIEDWLSQQITSGNWPEHYRIPSEIDLAAQFSVSRGTIRKAITGLIDKGMLISIHGRGTFVESRTIEQPLAEKLIAFSEALLEKNIPFSTRVVQQKLIQPQPHIASLLSIPEEYPVFYLERVRSVQQTPMIYLINFINVDRCSGIEKVDFNTFRLFQTLENTYHLDLGWGQRTFEAQAASQQAANMLDIEPCDPVMYMEQLVYLRNGSPIEFSNLWIRGSSFRLSAMVKRDGKWNTEPAHNTMLFETSRD